MTRLSSVLVCLMLLAMALHAAAETPVISNFAAGPYLFVDEALIDGSYRIERRIQEPERLPEPIVTGTEDKNFQPWLTVLRDPQTKLFRLWYNVPESWIQSHLGYMESEDGIHWKRPHRVLEDPAHIQYGACILDEGPDFADSSKRYKFAFWGEVEKGKGGMRIATSPDGLVWTMMEPAVVLQHNHDLNHLDWDPIRKQYIALVGFTASDAFIDDSRRITFQSVSKDLVNWETPWMVLKPDIRENWQMQFYGMSGLLTRGGLTVGLVKTLREDLNAEPGASAADMGDMERKAAGIGYTVLAWTRDGRTWTRDVDPFIPQNREPKTWDRAMAWGACQVPVDDEVYLYYAGYARGHKVERFVERQIGLAKMKRDRYVAREAGADGGKLWTVAAPLSAGSMTVNANARGSLRVRVLDPQDQAYPGYDWEDSQPIQGDAIDHAVTWAEPLEELRGNTVRFQFELKDAQLFSFDLAE